MATIASDLRIIDTINNIKQRFAINFRGSVDDRAILLRDVILLSDPAALADTLAGISQREEICCNPAAPPDRMFHQNIAVTNDKRAILSSIKQTTRDIGARIGTIQTSTREAVVAINQIACTIAEVDTISASVFEAMTQQDEATMEIARNIDETARSTARSTASLTGSLTGSMSDIARAATSTGQASKDVLDAAGDLSSRANHPSIIVGDFAGSITRSRQPARTVTAPRRVAAT